MIIKKLYLVAFVGVLLLLNSCAVIQQNYSFNKDGSGSFETGGDMSEAFALIEMMGAGSDENEKEEDPLKNIFKNAEERVDTLMRMEDIMPDSIKGTPEGEALKKWNMRMIVDKSNQSMYVGMLADFTNLKELGRQFKAVEKMQEGNDTGGPAAPGANGLDNLSSEYFTKYITFSKNKLVVKKYAYSEEELKSFKEMTKEGGEDSMLGLGEMMQNMQLKTRYQVPGTIKKIKFDGQYEKIDDSTIELTVPIKDVAEKGIVPALFIKWK